MLQNAINALRPWEANPPNHGRLQTRSCIRNRNAQKKRCAN